MSLLLRCDRCGKTTHEDRETASNHGWEVADEQDEDGGMDVCLDCWIAIDLVRGDR
jgi:nitrate/TMAO reductase-like tetraheme cytochrome c subunit